MALFERAEMSVMLSVLVMGSLMVRSLQKAAE
jgi:hypothetical protein